MHLLLTALWDNLILCLHNQPSMDTFLTLDTRQACGNKQAWGCDFQESRDRLPIKVKIWSTLSANKIEEEKKEIKTQLRGFQTVVEMRKCNCSHACVCMCRLMCFSVVGTELGTMHHTQNAFTVAYTLILVDSSSQYVLLVTP